MTIVPTLRKWIRRTSDTSNKGETPRLTRIPGSFIYISSWNFRNHPARELLIVFFYSELLNTTCPRAHTAGKSVWLQRLDFSMPRCRPGSLMSQASVLPLGCPLVCELRRSRQVRFPWYSCPGGGPRSRLHHLATGEMGKEVHLDCDQNCEN